MRLLIFIVLILFSPFAVADSIDPPLPALYRVTGVAPDDRLNVRSAPSANASILGSLAFDTIGIEVITLSREGKWGQINLGETAGWVSMPFLRAEPMATTMLGLPVGLYCFGTEPFWNIDFLDAMYLILSTPEGQTRHDIVSGAPRSDIVNLPETGFRFDWRKDQETITAHILPGQCSDGMSDGRFGLHYIDDQGPRVGCCGQY